MFGNTTRRWRAGGSAAAVLVGLALVATGCSSSSSGATGVPATDPSSSASTNDMYANALVGSAADILPNSTMAAIKKRGKLIVGEALDAPLPFQQDTPPHG